MKLKSISKLYKCSTYELSDYLDGIMEYCDNKKEDPSDEIQENVDAVLKILRTRPVPEEYADIVDGKKEVYLGDGVSVHWSTWMIMGN